MSFVKKGGGACGHDGEGTVAFEGNEEDPSSHTQNGKYKYGKKNYDRKSTSSRRKSLWTLKSQRGKLYY